MGFPHEFRALSRAPEEMPVSCVLLILKRVVSLQGLAMLGDELFECQERVVAEPLDVVIRAREDAVLVVDHDRAEMLAEEVVPIGCLTTRHARDSATESDTRATSCFSK